MTIETVEGSAKQLLHDAVPGDRPARARSPALPETRGERAIGGEAVDAPRRSPPASGAHDEAVLAVDDELERAAGVGGGDDRLRAEKRFERHVAVVFVERRVDDGERAGVERDQLVAADARRRTRRDRATPDLRRPALERRRAAIRRRR